MGKNGWNLNVNSNSHLNLYFSHMDYCNCKRCIWLVYIMLTQKCKNMIYPLQIHYKIDNILTR